MKSRSSRGSLLMMTLESMAFLFCVTVFLTTLYLSSNERLRLIQAKAEANILGQAGLDYGKYLSKGGDPAFSQKLKIVIPDTNAAIEMQFIKEKKGEIRILSRGETRISTRRIYGSLLESQTWSNHVFR